MRYLIIFLCLICCVSCIKDYGRQIPPTGIWSYQNSSFLHAQVIDIDLFSDGTFVIRQASGDSKTMKRKYEMLASGTYTIEGKTILFNLTGQITRLETFPVIKKNKNTKLKELKGTLSESGKELELDYFGPKIVFRWHSPS